MADGGVEGHIERGNGLKVSALIPGLRVPDSNTGQVNVLYSWVIHLTFTVPLSSQEGIQSTRRRSNSLTPTRRHIKSSRDVSELVLNPIQLIRS